jgi:copper chaperone CopZ
VEVLAEVVGEVTVHYLLPFLLDRVAGRPDRREPGVAAPVVRARPGPVSALRLVAAPAGVEVVSQAPGRMRARVAGLRGNPDLADDLVKSLRTVKGARVVRANVTTGSVLIHFDPARASAERLVRAIADVRSSRAIAELFPRDDDPLEIGLALVGS